MNVDHAHRLFTILHNNHCGDPGRELGHSVPWHGGKNGPKASGPDQRRGAGQGHVPFLDEPQALKALTEWVEALP